MANPFANPSVLTNLIKDMDALQLKRRPLQPHAISTLPTPQKQLYVTMLVAILINQNISHSQSRLLTMLLDSMKLEIKPAQLYDEVTLLDKNHLKELCELCDEHELAACFLMDVLVLCRLDTSLNHDQQRSIAELVNLLSIPESLLSDILHLSNEVLNPQPIDLSFDKDSLTTKHPYLYMDFDYDLLKPWHEFLPYQSLSAADLQTELVGGKWLVTNTLELNHDCNIYGAEIIFNREGKIFLTGGELNITNSYLQTAAISYQGIQCTLKNIIVNDGCFIFNNSDVSIVDSNFFNQDSRFLNPFIDYQSDVVNQLLSIKNCLFATRNRIALIIHYAHSVKILSSLFKECGVSKEIPFKGAIVIDDAKQFSCENTYFENNISESARDIYISNEIGDYNIEKCHFNNIIDKTLDWAEYSKQGTSMFISGIGTSISTNYYINYIKINNCMFINSSIHLHFLYRFQGYNDFLTSSPCQNNTFENSPIYSNYSAENFLSSCKFNNGDKPNLINM